MLPKSSGTGGMLKEELARLTGVPQSELVLAEVSLWSCLPLSPFV